MASTKRIPKWRDQDRANQGRHNQDLVGTHARLVRGATWKRQRVIVVMPAIGPISVRVAHALWSLAFPPNNGVAKIIAYGDEVGIAYSNVIASILSDKELSTWEYVLTVEHDNLPPSDGVMRLLQRMEEHPEFSGIGGLYFTKGEGGVAQIWGDPKDPILNFRPQLPDPSGDLVECNGTGMGFNLWRLKMFKDERLRRPWFRTEATSTQDLYFASDAKKWGYRFAVDCSVRVGHYDMTGAFGPPDTVW